MFHWANGGILQPPFSWKYIIDKRGRGLGKAIFRRREKNQIFLCWKWSLWPVSVSLSAAEQITPGVFSMGNTVMWILSIPFIMYERKCYKLAAVKTTMLHLYLWIFEGCTAPFHPRHSEMLNNRIHEYSAERQNRKKLQVRSSALYTGSLRLY